ncbi:MAG: protein kinase, partial [Planctomycetota bacterium]
ILGRGGMGTVYRAEHEETSEVCAVKALAPMYASDEHFRNRFESEIKALIQLDHPNVVRLISYGQEYGNLFFAMELVEGNSLFKMQKAAYRFDWREILQVGKDITRGLRHAHDRGIIHRDLKPGNVLRAQDGVNKITDFGIAKQFGGSQITGDNVLGTMDFMSPEQAKGKPVTARSDLYSLGTLLFTLLSGRPPFKANSVEESLRNLTRVPPPMISSVVPAVPEELDRLIRRLMDKDPEKRIQTAQALLIQFDEIEQRLRHESEAATSQRPVPTHETFETPLTKLDSAYTRQNTSEDPSAAAEKKSSAFETTVQSEVDSGEESRYVDPSRQQDYFATVTDQQRDRPLQEEEAKRGGTIPLLLALMAVVALTGYGLFRAYSVPPADELFASITEYASTPDRVRAEIAQFLDNYAEDERAAEVKELHQISEAIAIHNNISLRANATGASRLSELEQQFFDIVENSKVDPPNAFYRLNAFITLHGGVDELEGNDLKCMEAARSYLIKIKRDVNTQIDFNREKIEEGLSRAAEAEPANARPIYEAIISLYGDKAWAGDLVRRARLSLDQL